MSIFDGLVLEIGNSTGDGAPERKLLAPLLRSPNIGFQEQSGKDLPTEHVRFGAKPPLPHLAGWNDRLSCYRASGTRYTSPCGERLSISGIEGTTETLSWARLQVGGRVSQRQIADHPPGVCQSSPAKCSLSLDRMLSKFRNRGVSMSCLI